MDYCPQQGCRRGNINSVAPLNIPNNHPLLPELTFKEDLLCIYVFFLLFVSDNDMPKVILGYDDYINITTIQCVVTGSNPCTLKRSLLRDGVILNSVSNNNRYSTSLGSGLVGPILKINTGEREYGNFSCILEFSRFGKEHVVSNSSLTKLRGKSFHSVHFHFSFC